MIIKEKGKKHTCHSCGALFYDLKNKPITCPKCGTEVKARSLSKPRRSITRTPKLIEKKVDETEVIESDVENLDVEDDVDVVVEDKDDDDLIEDMSDMDDDDDMSEVKDHMSSSSDDKE